MYPGREETRQTDFNDDSKEEKDKQRMPLATASPNSGTRAVKMLTSAGSKTHCVVDSGPVTYQTLRQQREIVERATFILQTGLSV